MTTYKTIPCLARTEGGSLVSAPRIYVEMIDGRPQSWEYGGTIRVGEATDLMGWGPLHDGPAHEVTLDHLGGEYLVADRHLIRVGMLAAQD